MRRCGSRSNRFITEAHAFGSWPSTKEPEIPSDTAVRNPPTAVATTGVPQACASSATKPKLSEYDGTQTKSAARYQSGKSERMTGSIKCTTSSTPKNFASERNRSGST